MEKISVIVPVYNVEKYLEKCLESIRKQTYTNLEIILVDDGSSDNSYEICKKYVQMDTRFKVFHKKNGGQGSARNLALNYCTGEYICFIDSDDYVKNDYVEYLYVLLKERELDIAACNSENIDENEKSLGVRVSGSGYIEMSGIDAINSMWYRGPINIGPWGKLYKKYLWNNIRFQECYAEDYATMHLIYIQAKRIGFSHESKLVYLVRKNSSIRNFNSSKLYMLEIARNNMRFAEKYPEIKQSSVHKAVSVNFHILYQLPKDATYEKIKQEIIEFIKQNRKIVLRDSRCTKKTAIALILSYLNFDIVGMLLRIVHKKNASF